MVVPAWHAEAIIAQVSAAIGMNNLFHFSGNTFEDFDFSVLQQPAHQITDAGADDFLDAPAFKDL